MLPAARGELKGIGEIAGASATLAWAAQEAWSGVGGLRRWAR